MTDHRSYPITIEPGGLTWSCLPGETVIQSAWRHGYYWPTICGGAGECGACRCIPLAGQDNLGPPGIAEDIFFRTNPRIKAAAPSTRLACCLTVTGPVTLEKQGVKPR